jgi:hypothetical protein
MILRLPRTPRGTWLLAAAVWLVLCGALWSVLPYRPRASWPTEEPAVVHGFVPGTAVVLTSMPWSGTIDGPPGPMLGPLVARDAATGEVREWFPDGERLTLVDPGVDGRHVLVGRVIDGRARLFLHDAADGTVVAELPRGGPRAENENDQPRDAYEQFAAFRPDGRRIVYADRVDNQRQLRVWDLETRRETAVLRDAEPPAAWSPDGQSLAYTAPVDKSWSVRLWDSATGQTHVLGSPPFEGRRPEQLHFSPDGRSVVSVPALAREGGPAPWEVIVGYEAASERQTFRRPVRRAMFPANLPWFAIEESSDRPDVTCINRCDYATGATRDRFVLSETTDTRWLGLSPDGTFVLGHHWDDRPVSPLRNAKLLRGAFGELGGPSPVLWETSSGRLRHILPIAFEVLVEGTTSYAWSADGTLLALANGELTVWHIPPRKPLGWFAAGAALLALPPCVVARRRVRALRREAAA